MICNDCRHLQCGNTACLTCQYQIKQLKKNNFTPTDEVIKKNIEQEVRRTKYMKDLADNEVNCKEDERVLKPTIEVEPPHNTEK